MEVKEKDRFRNLTILERLPSRMLLALLTELGAQGRVAMGEGEAWRNEVAIDLITWLLWK